MSISVVASRYSKALFELGQEKSILDQMEEEVRAVREVFLTNEQLSTFLKHPKLSIEQKKDFVSNAFQDVSKEVLNTLKLMIDRHREDEILAMTESFIKLANEFKGIDEAEVYSVRELTNSEKESLENVFAEKLGLKALRLHNIVDSSILGGVKLKIGNRIYDGSVSGKLERFEKNLVSVNNR